MPVTKSAKKKLRKDRKRQIKNSKLKRNLKDILKKMKKNPSVDLLKLTTQITDKAAKKNIIHKNKAARIKSSISKLISAKPLKTEALTKTSKKSK